MTKLRIKNSGSKGIICLWRIPLFTMSENTPNQKDIVKVIRSVRFKSFWPVLRSAMKTPNGIARDTNKIKYEKYIVERESGLVKVIICCRHFLRNKISIFWYRSSFDYDLLKKRGKWILSNFLEKKVLKWQMPYLILGRCWLWIALLKIGFIEI